MHGWKQMKHKQSIENQAFVNIEKLPPIKQETSKQPDNDIIVIDLVSDEE